MVVAKNARDLLKSVFGYNSFRGQQEAIVNTLVNGENALVLMSTGAGKSLCYQIPALIRPGIGIVVSPLIALMHNQVSSLREVGIEAAYLNSSLSYAAQRRVEYQVINKQLDLLYVAPERLMTKPFLALLHRIEIALFAIDEAHCVSQWGHDFRPEYLRLGILAQEFKQVPRIALTATADQTTRTEILERLYLKDAKIFISGFDRPNIRYLIVEKNNPKKQVFEFIEKEHLDHAGIIYCLSRRGVDETAQWLNRAGRMALPYHAGLSQALREHNQARFLNEEAIVMVATIAFGMGVDKPNVRFVAHLDMPKSIEAYYQETGRAGRDSLPADAWLAYGLQDVIIHRQMVENSPAHEEKKRLEHRKLDALLGLCETTSCRRQTLLSYFGETLHKPCNNCDTCLTKTSKWDGTMAAKLAISAVFRTGQIFGVTHLIDVLLGKETEKVRKFSHQQLNVFGRGKDFSKTAWRAIFRQLIAMRHLKVEMESFGAVKLTKECAPIARGEQQIFLRTLAEKNPKRKTADKSSHRIAKDNDLFRILRELRQKLAKEQGLPPYVIFHDRTLLEMAEKPPETLSDLRKLYGIGEQKLEKYGQTFLNAVQEFQSMASH